MFESLIKDELVEHLENYAIIKHSQHGFVKGRSCLTNLIEHLENVSEELEKETLQIVLC